jgi:hypothetical protein
MFKKIVWFKLPGFSASEYYERPSPADSFAGPIDAMSDAEVDEAVQALTLAIHARAHEILELLAATYPDQALTAKTLPTVIAAVARNMQIPRAQLLQMVEYAYDLFTREPPALKEKS